MDVLDASPVRCEVHIKAQPRQVYEYFTDPAKMIRWKGIEAHLEPRPGGEYRVNVTGREIASGRYVELTPYSRIVFTWGWEGEGNPVPPGSSVVQVDLLQQDDGTLVQLTHRDLPVEVRAQHTVGWDHFLERLATSAAGGDPGPDPWVVRDS